MSLFPAAAAVLLSVASCYAQADYIKVKLNVKAVKDWHMPISDSLTTKLNAIPDVQVITEKCADCVFQIWVDVNQLLSQTDSVFGYDMMVLILGTYDNTTLTALLEEGEKTATTPAARRFLDFQKYLISGNIFLAGMDHFYGPTDAIDKAYDKVVSLLKSRGMPRYREFQKELAELLKQFDDKTNKEDPAASKSKTKL